MSSSSLKSETRLKVRWGDMDALGHVNNAVYFSYIEQARVDWLSKREHLNHGTEGFVLINTQCTFLKPVVYPANVIVRTYLKDVGNSSVTLEHTLTTEEDSENNYAIAEAKMVWIDYKAGKSRPLPQAIIEFFQLNLE